VVIWEGSPEGKWFLNLKISEPVKTQFGYHLIKVEEKIEPAVIAFDEVKDTIRRGLLQERQAYKYSELDGDLRKKYKVEIK